MKRISDYASDVELAIRAAGLEARQPATLYGPAAYGMSAGGKRLRPVLLLMAGEAYGMAASRLGRPAAGIEMFHNFTLLHDDVMDDSDTRRGRPTVHAKWDMNTAIITGDTMLTLATEMITDVADDCLRPVLRTFDRMALDVYEGQRLDMDFETRDDVTLDDYIRMIEGKTGALLGASAKIGALAAGAPAADADSLYEYGMKLGVAFQIQDDYLDVYGDAATFGKPIGGDILQGKKTYLLLRAYERGGGVAEALSAAMRMDAGELKIKTVRNIYDKAGVADDCRKAIAAYTGQALKALKGTTMADDAREAFKALADKLTGREK